MSIALPLKTSEKALKNPHFWVILVVSILLILIYQAWPWRPWDIEPWFPWLAPLYEITIPELVIHAIGLPFLVPIIYAAIVFSWKGALFAFLLALVGVLPLVVGFWSINSLITNITLLLLPVFVTSIVSYELTWRRKERRNSAEREMERRVYISEMLNSQENERLRLARELHDDTIQNLLVIANRAHRLIPAGDDTITEVRKNAECIRDAILQTTEDMRRVCLNLRPSILDDIGLIPALRWFADHARQESGINIRILVDGRERKLLSQTEVIIFRVIQEAINNIRRHSKATEADIVLKFTPKYLKISIEDNGQGFRPPKKFTQLATEGKLGLVGIKQRVDLLGGTFQARSQPGKGTLLVIKTRC